MVENYSRLVPKIPYPKEIKLMTLENQGTGNDSRAAGNSERVRRAALLEQLKGLYVPKERLTTDDKVLIKTIISLERGYDGLEVDCDFCHEIGTVRKDMTVSHKNGQSQGVEFNQLSNLGVAHGGCNTADFNRRRKGQPRRKRVQVDEVLIRSGMDGVSVRGEPMQAEGNRSTFTSTEGERHDKVRTKFDKYIIDVMAGPFANSQETRRRDPTFRRMWGLRQLSRFLVNVPELLDDGYKLSSVTFLRWLEEDAEGYGPLYVNTEEKPYKIGLKERIYQEQCKRAAVPESEYLEQTGQ